MALVAALVAGLAVLTVGAVAAGAAKKPAADPAKIALDHVKHHSGDFQVTDVVVSGHTGVTHVYLLQQHRGIDVFNAMVNVNVAPDGSVLSAGDRSIADLGSAVNEANPRKAAREGLASALTAVGLAPAALPDVKAHKGGAKQGVVFEASAISGEAVRAELAYYPASPTDVRLTWRVEVAPAGTDNWWNVFVDATSGDVLALADYTNDASYNVFAYPKESPSDGPRTAEVDPHTTAASPFGWHDTNGAPGAEHTVTRGNNVHAYTDLNADNVADPGSDPSGGPGLVFDFALDLATQQPAAYRPAAVTNLFYWNNVIHDVFYNYGFDEASGNFQVDNYGNGGLGGDDVRAEAQDGSGTNNANFLTLPDGQRPRMQMFVWTPPALVIVNSPAGIAGTYSAGSAGFGPALTGTGITGDVVLGLDAANAAGPSTGDACTALTNAAAVAGNVALVDRGTCGFVVKVKNAQNAGATAVIVADNVAGPVAGMGGADPTITIPSARVTLATGNLLKANLPVNATVKRASDLLRDSDLDNGVIAHEYGHGISNRLTGGPSTTSCLNTATTNEQMGEGWSDYIALVLSAVPGQTATQARGIGTYVSYQPPTGPGIRPTPYSTDMSVNGRTYASLNTEVPTGVLSIPHGVGYVWATMLWEVYWNLVQVHGFNPDVYDDWTTGGNNLAIQLVIDGMKLQPCSPGFVDGRNAILQADQILTGGDNQCLIWKGFAKRGLGASANQGSSASATDGTAAFNLPASCLAQASVAPASLSSSQLRDAQTSSPLAIANGSAAHGTPLNWTITETAGSCATPSDLPWASVAPGSGSTNPGSSSVATVTFDSAGLPIGSFTGKLCLASNDPSDPVIEVPLSLKTVYAFSGLDLPDTANAGRTIPVTFSLDGDEGSAIFAAGSPSSQQVDCTSGAPIGAPSPAETPGSSSLSYSAGNNRYHWNWKTDKEWGGTCRQLRIGLADGTVKTETVAFS